MQLYNTIKLKKSGIYPITSKLYKQSSGRTIPVKTMDEAKIDF